MDGIKLITDDNGELVATTSQEMEATRCPIDNKRCEWCEYIPVIWNHETEMTYDAPVCFHTDLPEPENIMRLKRCPDNRWYSDKPRRPKMISLEEKIEKKEEIV